MHHKEPFLKGTNGYMSQSEAGGKRRELTFVDDQICTGTMLSILHIIGHNLKNNIRK